MRESTLLDRLLAPGGLESRFQPIWEISGASMSLFALEALSRGPEDTHARSADVLFEYARRRGAEILLDRAAIAQAIAAVGAEAGDCAVSVNVHGTTLENDRGFSGFLRETCRRTGVSLDRIILEVVEQQRFRDLLGVLRMLAPLREDGLRVALDDLGQGHSGLRLLLEIRPELVKVDRYFVDGCSRDAAALATIESVVSLSAKLPARVVAEGIESPSDLLVLESVGVELVQGFLLGRPAPLRRDPLHSPVRLYRSDSDFHSKEAR